MPASPPARSLHQDGLGRWDLPRWGGPRQSLEQQIRIIRVTTPAEYPRELVQDVKLRDGSYIHIRPIRPEDAPRLQELYRSEEHTSELQSLAYLVCRLLLEKKKKTKITRTAILTITANA